VSQRPFHITGMDLSGYMVKDASRAIAFYRDVLGLEPVTVYPDNRGAEYELPDGTTFGSLGELAAIMSQGARGKEMTDFAVRQLMTYALSRPLKLTAPGDTDTSYLTQLSTQWAAQNYSPKALLLDAILNPTFRFRHGGI